MRKAQGFKDWPEGSAYAEPSAFFRFLLLHKGSKRMSDEKGSWVVPFVEQAMQGVDKQVTPSKARSYLTYAGGATASYAQGGALGALLGATHAKFGLDAMGFPLDGALAGLGIAVSIATMLAYPEVSAWALRRGEDAFAVFSFRKGYELVHGSELHSTGGSVERVSRSSTGKGSTGEDPIERVARGLNAT